MSSTNQDNIDHLKPGDLIEGGRKRIESDSLGNIAAPADHLWGAQTEPSLVHFSIGSDLMPKQAYHAYGYVKKAAAIANAKLGCLPDTARTLITKAADGCRSSRSMTVSLSRRLTGSVATRKWWRLR